MNAIKPPANTFPPISAELMKELEARWPSTLPPREQTPDIEDIRFRQGALSVIQLLRRQFDLQNKTIYEGR